MYVESGALLGKISCNIFPQHIPGVAMEIVTWNHDHDGTTYVMGMTSAYNYVGCDVGFI